MARILALTSRVPWPPREGHQLRSYHLLQALAAEHQVHLLSCARRDDTLDETAPLRDMLAGFETFAIPCEHSHQALGRALARGLLTRTPFVVAKYAIPALRSRLMELASGFDLIHVDMLPLMAYADPLPSGMPVVLNAHNVEHALLQARIDVEPRIAARAFLRSQLSKLQDFERVACMRAAAVLGCSRNDVEVLQALAPRTPVQVVANGVDLASNRPTAGLPHKPSQLVFVGQMGWFPNHDGVKWFLAEVMPRILAVYPGASFVLIGKPDGLQVPSALSAHVMLAGFMADVRPTVLDSTVYVVPLRAGSGTRLKVLEAMALGKAIVTTTVGAEGIELTHDRDALFADHAEDFAKAVVHLLSRPDDVARLGAAARQCAERRYGWDAIGKSMLPLYASLLR